MSFPSDPNFMVADRDAAWWIIRLRGGPRVLFSTTGYSMLVLLQTLLRNGIAPNTRSYRDSVISGSQINGDGNPGELTMKAVWAKLVELNGPELYQYAVEQDGVSRVISLNSQRAMIYVLMRMTGREIDGGVELPETTRPLVFGVRAPVTPIAQPTFITLAEPSAPPVTTPTEIPPVTTPGETPPGPIVPDDPGKAPPGPYVPPVYPTGLPPSQSGTREATLSWPIIGAAAAAVFVVGGLIVSTVNESKPRAKPKKARKNPSRKSRKKKGKKSRSKSKGW